jgi:hypothetical protein
MPSAASGHFFEREDKLPRRSGYRKVPSVKPVPRPGKLPTFPYFMHYD